MVEMRSFKTVRMCIKEREAEARVMVAATSSLDQSLALMHQSLEVMITTYMTCKSLKSQRVESSQWSPRKKFQPQLLPTKKA
jgi:hypothetical protein